MTARRLPLGGDIDRARPVRFTFDGHPVQGCAGDTIASALLASGVTVVARSFKYHRPRGLWGAWVEEPNALFDVVADGQRTPNVRATTEFLDPDRPELATFSVNAAPSAERDSFSFIDRFARFIPAGFYYKTFMWPNWHLFEPSIRKMAGLGRIDPDTLPAPAAQQATDRCDVLIIGAGPAGLACADAMTDSGLSVLVVDDQPLPGGSLLHRQAEVDGLAGRQWVRRTVAGLEAADVRLMTSTTAYGIYDHNLVCLVQRLGNGRPDMLWRVRAAHIVIAAGAIERPLIFANNDRPGVMSADACLRFLRRFAVLAGRNVAVATNNDSAYEAAVALAEAGSSVTVLDTRAGSQAASHARASGVRVFFETVPHDVVGRYHVEAIVTDREQVPADTLLVSGGLVPTVHLFCQARGKLTWDDTIAAFVPELGAREMSVIGAARGCFGLGAILADAARVASAIAGRRRRGSHCSGPDMKLAIQPAWPVTAGRRRAWIDLQNDVTVGDVELAVRENFRSVEHLKRYTTIGMATDQGKTSNLNSIAMMASLTEQAVLEIGTTTYRPPYTPVSLLTVAGRRRGEFFNPLRRLVLERRHRADGAVMREYGGWLRPAYYGPGPARDEIQREAVKARQTVALFDASTLGKLEVLGPQAAVLVDFNYYNTMSNLASGRIRYGLMLQESGVIYDDGVVLRLGEHSYVVSCSSSHLTGVHARLEEWRQDSFDPAGVFVHDVTAQWATLTATGPLSRELVDRLDLGTAIDDKALAHMSFAHGVFQGQPIRISRVSFTGDRCYEISLPASQALELWLQMKSIAAVLDGVLMGVEALAILRAEKGFIMIGKDTDGLTMPHDIGMMGPRDKKRTEYVGKRSLFTGEAARSDRRQLVGLDVPDGQPALATGAHGIEVAGRATRSLGYVTSSYESPTLGRPIALGLIERGRERIGGEIIVQHLGKRRHATVVVPCALDPEGRRLHA